MATILLVEARFYGHLNDMLLAGARRGNADTEHGTVYDSRFWRGQTHEGSIRRIKRGMRNLKSAERNLQLAPICRPRLFPRRLRLEKHHTPNPKLQTPFERIRAQTGTCSTISNPYPSKPTTLRVLFESNLILPRPSAARICAPMP